MVSFLDGHAGTFRWDQSNGLSNGAYDPFWWADPVKPPCTGLDPNIR